MNFKFSHIFREGNCLADVFANYGADHAERFWWSYLLDFAMNSFNNDMRRLPYFRAAYELRIEMVNSDILQF